MYSGQKMTGNQSRISVAWQAYTHTYTYKSISIVSMLFLSSRVCILCLIGKKSWRAKKREGLMCLFHLCSNAPSDRRSTCAAVAQDDDLLGRVSLHRLLESTTLLIILQRKVVKLSLWCDSEPYLYSAAYLFKYFPIPAVQCELAWSVFGIFQASENLLITNP